MNYKRDIVGKAKNNKDINDEKHGQQTCLKKAMNQCKSLRLLFQEFEKINMSVMKYEEFIIPEINTKKQRNLLLRMNLINTVAFIGIAQ